MLDRKASQHSKMGEKVSNTSEMLTAVGKLIILLVGVIVLVLGLYSHFQSEWIKRVSNDPDARRVYEICYIVQSSQFNFSCPAISLERYFAAIVIICFAISVVNFVVGCGVDLGSKPLKWIDMAIHVASAVLLCIGGIVYIVSATQISRIVDSEEGIENLLRGIGFDFKTKEKLAAGSIAIVQALLYGIVSILIGIT